MARVNISPYKGNVDIDHDYYGFIDESGGEGTHELSPDWLVVSGVVFKIPNYQQARDQLLSQIQVSRKEPKNFSFKNMNHNTRKGWSSNLGLLSYTTMHSAFCNKQLSPEERGFLKQYPSMYHVGVKNVVERMSWMSSQYGGGRVHIMIAGRNKLSGSVMGDYLFKSSVNANRNLMYLNKIGHVYIGKGTDYGIMLADTIASSMYQALQVEKISRMTEEAYFNLCIKDHLYSSNHEKYKGVWGNGFKCTPNNPELINKNIGILTEGSSSRK